MSPRQDMPLSIATTISLATTNPLITGFMANSALDQVLHFSNYLVETAA